jgi:hypothetical protein
VLCWTLVVAAVVAAVSQLLLATNLWAGGPNEVSPTADLVERLLVFRSNDQEIFGPVLVGGLAAIVVFVAIGLIGVAIRPLAADVTGRDMMATLLIAAAAVGIVSQALQIGVAQAATHGYCDCGYKTEEVIAQDYALSVGFIVQSWLGNAAVVLVGLGALLAGRYVSISPTWRFLSYGIAILLILATALRLVALFVFLDIDLFQISDIVAGLTLAILVPIWAIMLARGAGKTQEPATA